RALRELHKQILNQDPELDVDVEPRASTEATTTEATTTDERRPSAAASARESRKTVTVVCAALELRGSDGQALDPEALRRVYARAHAEIEAALARHGGAVVAVGSDLVTAVYGIPAVHEDDARRGLRS